MHIYNMDETGINVIHKSGRILTELGRKKVWALTSGEKGKTHTVVSCVSASGNVIPPMMIYPRKHMTDKLKSGAVPGTLFACSDNGWINQQLYLQWFEFFVASIPPACPVLLIEDGHASHISLEVIKLAQENDIHLLCLPSHTTHLLQPLDVGVFKSMKSQFNKACKHFMTSKPGRIITSEDLASLLAVTWPQCMTPVNIMSGFRKCGIYPLNPGAVKDYETAPSKSLCFPSDSQDQEPDISTLSPETQPPQCSSSTSEQTISILFFLILVVISQIQLLKVELLHLPQCRAKLQLLVVLTLTILMIYWCFHKEKAGNLVGKRQDKIMMPYVLLICHL